MGHRERGGDPSAYFITEPDFPLQIEEVFSGREIAVPGHEGRKLYEFPGREDESMQFNGYRRHLRLLQEQYIAAGLHREQKELTGTLRTVLTLTARGFPDKAIAEAFNESKSPDALIRSDSSIKKDNTRINALYGTKNRLERVLNGAILGDIDLTLAVDRDILRRLGYQHFAPREWKVMVELVRHLGENRTRSFIAQEMGISKYTANSHMDNIMDKLGVSNRTLIGTHMFVALVSTGDYSLELPTEKTHANVVFDAIVDDGGTS